MFSFLRRKTALDVINESTVEIYRKYAGNSLSDSDLLEVIQTTMRAFKDASVAKNENISGQVLMNITAFMVMYRSNKPKDDWLSHLNNEVELYLRSGLRNNYKNNYLVRI